MSEKLKVFVFVENASNVVLPAWFEVLGKDVDLILVKVSLTFVKHLKQISIDKVDLSVKHIADYNFLDVTS